jgi:hypothetical protein
VRIVSAPLKEYSRYALWSVQGNLAAGEDIRYLSRSHAIDLGLPSHDSWLFDSRQVAILNFGDDDSLLGAEVVTRANVIAQHHEWRVIAWENSMTREEFIELHDRT